MKAEELDKKFDQGLSVLEHFDLSIVKRPCLETKRVNVDFPMWMLDTLDKEAHRLGIHRQAVI
ncbi:MAG: CopG family transcriptional regulator [Cyanobacteria bacterium P01_A01_bin.37]